MSKKPHRETLYTFIEQVTIGSVYKGVKVKRGPDWKWGEQDGGDGKTGKYYGLILYTHITVLVSKHFVFKKIFFYDTKLELDQRRYKS